MATLDKIIQMQQEGKSDNEIMAQLQNEGVQPSEISNAINQAKIKNAVSPPEQPLPQSEPTTNNQQSATTPEMQASIMPTQDTATPQQPIQPSAPQQEPQTPAPQQPEAYPQQEPQQDYYTPQPQSYSEQDYYPQQEGYGTETISEIAEQVATEKLEDYKTKVGDIASFKTQIQNQVNNIDDRLKRIESSIDKLQQAILGKIGEYGENYAMVHKDLDNLHGTIAKLMNPLIDNVNEMKKANKK